MSQKSLKKDQCTDKLKIAKVKPLFKSGNVAEFSNYRPVSVLPIFSKLLEKLFYDRLEKYVNSNNILCNNVLIRF